MVKSLHTQHISKSCIGTGEKRTNGCFSCRNCTACTWMNTGRFTNFHIKSCRTTQRLSHSVKIYVWKTFWPLKTRMSEHNSAVWRADMTSPVARHFRNNFTSQSGEINSAMWTLLDFLINGHVSYSFKWGVWPGTVKHPLGFILYHSVLWSWCVIALNHIRL